MPFMSPNKVVQRPDGRISHLVLARNEQDDEGNWFEDEEQTMKKKCDFIISAFGSGLYSQDLKVKEGSKIERLHTVQKIPFFLTNSN